MASLRARPGGELLVVGSAALARWLVENELLFPAQGTDFALDLIDSRVFRTGIVALTYRVGGRPAYA